jgi:integrase
VWFTWVMQTHYLLVANPCKLTKRNRNHQPDPRVMLWEPHEIAALVKAADDAGLLSIGDAIMLAVDLGWNPQDILGLKWTQIDTQFRTKHERLKTGVEGAPRLISARERVVQIARRWEGRERPANIVIYEPKEGAPYRQEPGVWGESNFRQTFDVIRQAANATLVKAGRDSILHKHFQDFRDTGITNMARAGLTVPEICSRALLSLESATAILKHYLGADQAFADAVSDKIEAYLDKQRQEHRKAA